MKINQTSLDNTFNYRAFHIRDGVVNPSLLFSSNSQLSLPSPQKILNFKREEKNIKHIPTFSLLRPLQLLENNKPKPSKDVLKPTCDKLAPSSEELDLEKSHSQFAVIKSSDDIKNSSENDSLNHNLNSAQKYQDNEDSLKFNKDSSSICLDCTSVSNSSPINKLLSSKTYSDFPTFRNVFEAEKSEEKTSILKNEITEIKAQKREEKNGDDYQINDSNSIFTDNSPFLNSGNYHEDLQELKKNLNNSSNSSEDLFYKQKDEGKDDLNKSHQNILTEKKDYNLLNLRKNSNNFYNNSEENSNTFQNNLNISSQIMKPNSNDKLNSSSSKFLAFQKQRLFQVQRNAPSLSDRLNLFIRMRSSRSRIHGEETYKNEYDEEAKGKQNKKNISEFSTLTESQITSPINIQNNKENQVNNQNLSLRLNSQVTKEGNSFSYEVKNEVKESPNKRNIAANFQDSLSEVYNAFLQELSKSLDKLYFSPVSNSDMIANQVADEKEKKSISYLDREYKPHIFNLPLITPLIATILPIFSSLQTKIVKELDNIRSLKKTGINLLSDALSLEDINTLINTYRVELLNDPFICSVITSGNNSNSDNHISSSYESSTTTYRNNNQGVMRRMKLLTPRRTLSGLFVLKFVLLLKKVLFFDGLTASLSLIGSGFFIPESNLSQNEESGDSESKKSPSLPTIEILKKMLTATQNSESIQTSFGKGGNNSNKGIDISLLPQLSSIHELLQSSELQERMYERRSRVIITEGKSFSPLVSRNYINEDYQTKTSSLTSKSNNNSVKELKTEQDTIIKVPLALSNGTCSIFRAPLSIRHSICTVVIFILYRWRMNYVGLPSGLEKKDRKEKSIITNNHFKNNTSSLYNEDSSPIHFRTYCQPSIIILVRNQNLVFDIQSEIDREKQGDYCLLFFYFNFVSVILIYLILL